MADPITPDPITQWNEGWDGDDPDALKLPPPGRHSVYESEVSPPIILDADPVAHSDEAMKILMEEGVEAYQAYLAQQ